MRDRALRRLVLLAMLLISANIFAKTLPDNMKVSNDGARLFIKGDNGTGLYCDTIIRTFYIEFEESNWQQILTENYNDKIDLAAKLIVDGEERVIRCYIS